jgi:hypothetical protein
MFRPLQQAIIRDLKTLEVRVQRTENISFFTNLSCHPYNAVHVVGAKTNRR